MTAAQTALGASDEHSMAFVGASMLMDTVEEHALAGDLFSAGCWWHEAARMIQEIVDRDEREAAVRRHREIEERVSGQRAEEGRAGDQRVRVVRSDSPEKRAAPV